MDKEIIVGLVYNAALLLLLSIIYNAIFVQFEKTSAWKSVLSGVIIGAIGVSLMLTSVSLAPGVFFDTRSILVSVTAMFFGFIPTVTAAVIICAGRIIIGGDGMLMGVLVTLLTAAIGLLWNKFRLQRIAEYNRRIFLEFYIVGLLTHAAMILCIFALPRNTILTVFMQMWCAILLIYPVMSFLLSGILYSAYLNDRTRLKLIDSENRYKELYYENQNKETLLKKLIDSVLDLVFYKDINGYYLGCNVAFAKYVGMTENEIVGLTDYDIFSKEKAELFIALDKKIIEHGKPTKNDEVAAYPDGTQVYLETLKTSYCDKQGSILGVIGISRDITERKKIEKEIQHLTNHDGLTGLFNRTVFDKKMIELDTPQQLPLSVIMGDINGLKLINDAFGHREGDKMLIEVAKILTSCVRNGDITARIGGDEFGILLPQTDSKTAHAVVDRIKIACELYANRTDKETYYMSISLGYDTKLEAGEAFETVIKSAEEFMYRRKLLEYKSLHSSIITSIKTTMYEKSHETEEHTERMAALAKKLGGILKLTDKEIDELELLSMLHDIGKIGVEDSILTKCGSLTEDEWREMRRHPEIGFRIASAAPELRHVAEYILCHHERWDGKGYPQGLFGEEIPVLSRILSVVDSYDAMTNDRVYRKAIPEEDARAEILNNAGTQFDPRIAKIFVHEILEKQNGDEEKAP
ncbi:MAG: diguanylate cyclase [Oscillospiraceae bacterium]|nr:diguanylate cyclase [Oscillospiraceae bacterium]